MPDFTCPPFAAVLALLFAVGLTATNAHAQTEAKKVEAGEEANAAEAPKPKEKPVTGETLALEAAQVQSEHCADAYGRDMTRALKSIAAVGNVWARLSEQYEKSGETFLRYWRGVLAQCMDQEARGLADLQAFVAESGSNTLWAALVKDAKRRIRQLERKTGASRAAAAGPLAPEKAKALAGVIVGGSLTAGSVVSSILAKSYWDSSLAQAAAIYDAEIEGLKGSDQLSDGQQAFDTSIVLTTAAIAMGAGAVVSFIVAARTGSSAGTAQAPPILVPTRSGAVVTWEARW
jgi:hypothetical protein